MAKKKSMTEVITENLRAEILEGAYYSQALFTEQDISQKFGSSKTPAREALGILCAEGLLEKLPSKGYLVKRYSMEELEHLLQFRSVLESAIVDFAIQRASDRDIDRMLTLCDKADSLSREELDSQCVVLNREFHIELAKLSGNPYLVSATVNLMDQLRVAMGFDRSTERLMAGHRDVVGWIKNRDIESATKWARRFLPYIPGDLVGRFMDNDLSRNRK